MKHQSRQRFPVLFIGGSDPSGGAGIQADLKSCQALGGHGMAAITAITVQSTQGVSHVEPLAADLVTAQIKAVLDDIRPRAIKVGMLGSGAIATALAEVLPGDIPVVLDPVLKSSSGASLLDGPGRAALDGLLPRLALLTPNIPEAQALVGKKLEGDELMGALKAALPCPVLLKGGHGGGAWLVDRLWDGRRGYRLEARKRNSNQTHGTGCTLAAAIATCLAKGHGLPLAVTLAHQYLQGAIARAAHAPLGKGPHGPLWH
ncbi:bifunctional hydroxymethylpyrimidine kinase/phosphomethylpyrimidine kinase [Gallaecimonas sp. GXIMD4217]|uniref:bifunctional hydroxymethylpyrimidine kinase/phosphomethylpyrimidine kinase n=1 Tax=Gallaecimonas sp. GXIMD4217 TaxID=3131927 RepID=UPI00311AFD52